MSREDLNNFYYAVEHNYALKLKLSKCDKNTGLLTLAKEYGFSISIDDLAQDEIAQQVNNWFVLRRHPVAT